MASGGSAWSGRSESQVVGGSGWSGWSGLQVAGGGSGCSGRRSELQVMSGGEDGVGGWLGAEDGVDGVSGR